MAASSGDDIPTQLGALLRSRTAVYTSATTIYPYAPPMPPPMLPLRYPYATTMLPPCYPHATPSEFQRGLDRTQTSVATHLRISSRTDALCEYLVSASPAHSAGDSSVHALGHHSEALHESRFSRSHSTQRMRAQVLKLHPCALHVGHHGAALQHILRCCNEILPIF